MAEEPQPPTIHEGADPEDEPPISPPKSAEDRKTAAALSSLDKRGDEDDDGASGAKSQLDQEALGKAMSRLEVGGKKGGESEGKGKGAKEGDGEGEVVRRKAVKVDQADVVFLVEELELSKGKATDLLKAHEGDAVKAMRAFVTASA